MMNKKFVLVVILLVGVGIVWLKGFNLEKLLPFGILLICPIMMLFMMGGHKHKE